MSSHPRSAQPAKPANPAEIAREAIRQLASSRVAPTPENFARAYGEASGGSADFESTAVEPENLLKQLLQGIANRYPEDESLQKLQEQVKSRAWSSARKGIDEVVAKTFAEGLQDWPRLLGTLLQQIDANHANWTRARKLGAVRHVLTTTSSSDRTREKLERLVAGWGVKAADAGNSQLPVQDIGTLANSLSADTGESRSEASAWRLLALTAMDMYQPVDRRRSATAELPADETLGGRLARCAGIPGAEWLHEIQIACADSRNESSRQAELRDRLVRLLRRLCENLALFADDDTWVSGQVERITRLLAAPLSEQSLTEAEDGLQRAVWRQAELKADLKQAKAAVKEMLATLIERLASATVDSGNFHVRISGRAEEIRQAHDLPSLTRVVAGLLDDTIEMRDATQRTHDELNNARKTAEQYETRMRILENELAEVSDLVRVDPLTQVLNRRGLEDAFGVRQARAAGQDKPMSAALLDIDNFKCLNDTLGHQAGDLALKHVADMIRNEVRPADVVARYGGEEFVILLEKTTARDGVAVLKRLQRQLTRAIFLHNNEKVLITFSAGIAEVLAEDTQETVLRRADAALYLAKAAGKNCVQIG